MKATASCQTLSVSTPIIQSLRAIEDAIIECGDSENLTDIANRKVIARVQRKVQKLKNQTVRSWDYIVLSHTNDLTHSLYSLVGNIGNDDVDAEDIESETTRLSESFNIEIGKNIEQLADETVDELDELVHEIMDSSIGAHLNQVHATHTIGYESTSKDNSNAKRSAVDIGKNISKGLGNLSSKTLYNIVEKVGHKVLNIKFKPWGITKVAGKLGKAFKALGPAMEIFSFAMEIKETVDENKQAKEMLRIRREYKEEVRNSVNEIKTEYDKVKREFISELFDNTLSEFDSIQQTIVSNDASNKETQTNLLNFKKKYEKILNDVHFV